MPGLFQPEPGFMLKVFLFAVSTLLLACTLSCNQHSSGKAKDESEAYLVGINLTLSGNAAYYGSEVYKGLELAFKDAEKKYECRFTLFTEDNRFMPQEAVGITKKFLHVTKPHLIISGYTNLLQTIIPLVEAAGMPMIATLSSSVDLAREKQWVIRDFALESQLMPLLADYIFSQKGLRKGSFLVVNDDFGHDSRDYFKHTFESLGGSFESGAVFNEDELDLRTLVGKIMSTNPEFVLVIGRGAGMANVIRQIRELNPEVVICGSNSFDNQKIMESLGAAAEGLIYVNFSKTGLNTDYFEISQRFIEKHQYRMNWVNMVGYSLGEYAAQSLVASSGEPKALLSYLRQENFSTIRGQLKVNQSNDMLSDISVYVRENNQSNEIPKSNQTLTN